MKRFLYFNSKPEVASQAPEKDLGKEYERVQYNIDTLEIMQRLSASAVGAVLDDIDTFRIDLLNSGQERSFQDGNAVIDLYQHLKGVVYAKLGVDDLSQLKIYGGNSIDSGAVKPPKGLNTDFLIVLSWLADPHHTFKELSESSAPDETWSEEKVAKVAWYIKLAADTHENLVSSEEVRTWYTTLYAHVDETNIKNPHLLQWLKHQKEFFIHEGSLSTTWLNEEARKELVATCDNLYAQGLKVTDDQSAVLTKAALIGSVESSSLVTQILKTSNIPSQGNEEYPLARPQVYCFLLWHFYRGLMANGNKEVSGDIKVTILREYLEMLDVSGFKSGLGSRKSLSEELANLGEENFSQKSTQAPKEDWIEGEERYSPMIAEGSLDSDETFEIPETMDLQLNRLGLLYTMVEGFGINLGGGVLGELTAIQKKLIEHYKDPSKGNAFDLDTELANSETLKRFLADFEHLLSNDYYIEVKDDEGKVTYEIKTGDFTELDKQLAKRSSDRGLIDGVSALKKDSGYFNALLNLVKGKDFQRSDINKAGLLIARFFRSTIGNYEGARDLMSRLLYRHMSDARENVPEETKAKLHAEAKREAERRKEEFLREQGNETKNKIRTNYVNTYHAYVNRIKEEKGDETPVAEPTNDQINLAVADGFQIFENIFTETAEEAIYSMLLDKIAVKTDYFKLPDNADIIDRDLLMEYADSADPNVEWLNLEDETVAFLAKSGEVLKEIGKEIGIMILAIVASELTSIALVAGGTRVLRFLVNVTRLTSRVRLAYGLWGVRAFNFLGSVALQVSKLAGFSAGFTQAYPFLKNEKTLLDIYKDKGIGEAVNTVLGEMAMFGPFHALGFIGKMFKFGASGRSLMLLAAENPGKYAKAVNYVFKNLKDLEPQKALAALEEMATKGMKLSNGTFRQLPEEIRSVLSRSVGDVKSLQARYINAIEKIENKALKTVLGFMVHDLAFDMAGMLIGTLAKDETLHLTLGKDVDILKALSADSLFQMFTTAIGFRVVFGGLGRLGKGALEICKKLGAKSNIEALSIIDERILKITNEQAEIEGKLSKMDDSPTVLQEGGLTVKVSGTRKREALKEKLASLKSQKEEYERQRKELEGDLGKGDNGDYLVPSTLARILPKKLRQALYRDYKNEQGEFLGSDGFVKMLSENFEGAMRILERAERSILSPAQTLAISLRLGHSERLRFIKAMAKIMSQEEKLALKQRIDDFDIPESDIPDSFRGELGLPKASGSLPLTVRLAQNRKLQLALNAIYAPLMSFAIGTGILDRPLERPSSIKPKAESFRVGGELAQPEAEYIKLPKAKDSSEFFVLRFGEKEGKAPEAKEWTREQGKKVFSANGDVNVDQVSILESAKGGGFAEGLLAAIKIRFSSLPDGAKPYIRIIPTVDAEGKQTSYTVVDFARMKAETGIDMSEHPAEALKALEGVSSEEFNVIMTIARLLENESQANPEVLQAGFTLGDVLLFVFPLEGLGILLTSLIGLLSAGGYTFFSLIGLGSRVLRAGFKDLFHLRSFLTVPAEGVAATYRLGKWAWNRQRHLGPGTTNAVFIDPELFKNGEDLGFDKILETIRQETGNAVSTDAAVDKVHFDFLAKVNGEIKSFYHTLVKLFKIDIKVDDPGHGAIVFQNLLKWVYVSFRSAAIRKILDGKNGTPGDVSGGLYAALETELGHLTEVSNGLKQELLNVAGEITWINLGSKDFIIRKIGEVIKTNLSDAKDVEAATQIAEGLVDHIAKSPPLKSNYFRLRTLIGELALMKPAYDKANTALSTLPAGLEKDTAQATVDAYLAAQAEYTALEGSMRGTLVKVAETLPIKRRSRNAIKLVAVGMVWGALKALPYVAGSGSSTNVPITPSGPSEMEKARDKANLDKSRQAPDYNKEREKLKLLPKKKGAEKPETEKAGSEPETKTAPSGTRVFVDGEYVDLPVEPAKPTPEVKPEEPARDVTIQPEGPGTPVVPPKKRHGKDSF